MGGTKVTIPYTPRSLFWPFHKTTARHRIVRAHRRFGKTTGLINHLIREATTDPKKLAERRNLEFTDQTLRLWKETPRLFAYIAPYWSQAKSIAWSLLKHFSAPLPEISINESELRIDYPMRGQVRLFGADNAHALRGLKFWEVVMDEFSDFDPLLWKEVIVPACLDAKAPITFAGTTKGGDHFFDLAEEKKDDPNWFNLFLPISKTKLFNEEELGEMKKVMGEFAYRREMELEATAIEGAIFGTEMQWLEEHGHFLPLEIEKRLPVDTFWDLGVADYTIVLFIQNLYSSVNIVDAYATYGESMADIAVKLQKKNYLYGTHYLPHDANNRELTTGVSRKDFLKERLFGQIEIIERPHVKEDALDTFRTHYTKLYFNQPIVKDLVTALRNYKREFDSERRVFLNVPKHDSSSHFCDAIMLVTQKLARDLRYLGINDKMYSHETNSEPFNASDEDLIPQ